MKPLRIEIENNQFRLYYMLMAIDGNVSEEEKEMFVEIVSGTKAFTRSYAESMFNVMHKFRLNLNYKSVVEVLKETDEEIRIKTIEMLMKLSMADNHFNPKETEFIIKCKRDLNLEFYETV